MKRIAYIIALCIALAPLCLAAEETVVEKVKVKDKVVEKSDGKTTEIVEVTEEKVKLAEPVSEDIVEQTIGSEDSPATAKKIAEKKDVAPAKQSAAKADPAAMAEGAVVEPAKSAKAKSTKKAKSETVETLEVDEEVTTEQMKEMVPATTGEVKPVEYKIQKNIKVAPGYMAEPRKGKFRAGLVGPGVYGGNKSIGVMMSIGAEGEYFVFEKLSAGMRIQVATNFKANDNVNAITSFLPQARYVFDFDSHPRFSLYVQAGAGVALLDTSNIAADIAIPGVGFWWQYNENFSIGFEATMHILARSTVAIAGQGGPTFRYQF